MLSTQSKLTDPPLTLHKGRIEALSDGIFAIAMTLLVLELHIPELPHGTTQAELLEALKHVGRPMASFVISFVLASAYWLTHHLSFQFVRHTNPALCIINLGLLFFVTTLPFSTGLYGRYMHVPFAETVYFGNQAALGGMLLLHWTYAGRAGLLDHSSHPGAAKRLGRRIRVLTAGPLGAVIASLVAPEWCMHVFIAVIIVGRLVILRLNRAEARAT